MLNALPTLGFAFGQGGQEGAGQAGGKRRWQGWEWAELHCCAALDTGARLKNVMHSYESESMSLGDLSS